MESPEKFSFSEVYEYILSGNYPPSCSMNYKRSLRRKANKFKIYNGQLYYIGNQEKRKGVTVSKTSTSRLVIEKKEEQQRLLKTIHEDGHLGMTVVTI